MVFGYCLLNLRTSKSVPNRHWSERTQSDWLTSTDMLRAGCQVTWSAETGNSDKNRFASEYFAVLRVTLLVHVAAWPKIFLCSQLHEDALRGTQSRHRRIYWLCSSSHVCSVWERRSLRSSQTLLFGLKPVDTTEMQGAWVWSADVCWLHPAHRTFDTLTNENKQCMITAA